MGGLTFPEAERLKNRKEIELLFSKGQSFSTHPYKVYFQVTGENSHKVLFSASARNFKKAVERNKIKRRSREAYRLNKSLLNDNPKLAIGFVYTAREILPYAQMLAAIVTAIKKLNTKAHHP